MIRQVKVALRITNTAFDEEVFGLIEAAKSDLALSGVTNINEYDPLIARAITTYCKAHFGYDNPDADRLQRAYDSLKGHLSLAGDYAYYTVTFTITAGGLAVEDAVITFNGATLETNTSGVAVFKHIKAGVNQDYTISHKDYTTVADDLDVTANAAVTVVMV